MPSVVSAQFKHVAMLTRVPDVPDCPVCSGWLVVASCCRTTGNECVLLGLLTTQVTASSASATPGQSTLNDRQPRGAVSSPDISS